jgi:predicted RNase H-like HicB family nuclease
MDRYIYPAVFSNGVHHGYTVCFPDLPGCITEGDTLADALHMAKEALELHMYGLEEDHDMIPEPSPPETIQMTEGSFVSLVEVWMPLVRDEMQNRAVKKTLTIPKWLNDIAEKNKVNFSQVLQLALKAHLGVSHVHRPSQRS